MVQTNWWISSGGTGIKNVNSVCFSAADFAIKAESHFLADFVQTFTKINLVINGIPLFYFSIMTTSSLTVNFR